MSADGPSTQGDRHEVVEMCVVDHLAFGDEDLRAGTRGLHSLGRDVLPVGGPRLEVYEDDQVREGVLDPALKVVDVRLVVPPSSVPINVSRAVEVARSALHLCADDQ